jgi:toxin CptA
VIVALVLIGLSGALAALGSGMPRVFAWPLAVGAASRGIWLALGRWGRSRCEVVWPPDAKPTIDGHVLQHAKLHWRGPLAFLDWRDDLGRRHHLAWWPDTLSPQARRELRLAAASHDSTPSRTSMAP